MRASRLITLLFTMQRRRTATAAELARELRAAPASCRKLYEVTGAAPSWKTRSRGTRSTAAGPARRDR